MCVYVCIYIYILQGPVRCKFVKLYSVSEGSEMNILKGCLRGKTFIKVKASLRLASKNALAVCITEGQRAVGISQHHETTESMKGL